MPTFQRAFIVLLPSRMNLEIGSVYQVEWDRRPYRVIGLDDVEVFYDCMIDEQSWIFSGNFGKKCFFYRTSVLVFGAKSTKIDHIPLSKEEQVFFRPDLTMRIGRTKQLNWNQMNFGTRNDLDHFIHLNLPEDFTAQKVETNAIIVYPYGPAGGLKKGEKIIADNGTYFSAAELIWKSKEIQESVNRNPSDGIGLYRIGAEKGFPSYYIGEYLDKANLLKE